jgi:hypothetical protein
VIIHLLLSWSSKFHAYYDAVWGLGKRYFSKIGIHRVQCDKYKMIFLQHKPIEALYSSVSASEFSFPVPPTADWLPIPAMPLSSVHQYHSLGRRQWARSGLPSRLAIGWSQMSCPVSPGAVIARVEACFLDDQLSSLWLISYFYLHKYEGTRTSLFEIQHSDLSP